MATSRMSAAYAGDAPVAAPGQAYDRAAGTPLAIMRTELDEPAVGVGGFDAGGAAGDGPPAFGADAFRALLRGHRTAVTRPGPVLR
jgi:hypothetical protein